jgi:hypothetical protein
MRRLAAENLARQASASYLASLNNTNLQPVTSFHSGIRTPCAAFACVSPVRSSAKSCVAMDRGQGLSDLLAAVIALRLPVASSHSGSMCYFRTIS